MDGRRQYKAKYRHDHKTAVVRKWFGLYAWFWYHTEFWLKSADRRPYTYIMRDWIYPHMRLFVTLLIVWYIYMGVIAATHPLIAVVCSTLSGWLAAHLIWGGKWICGEQEWPPVTDH